MLDTLSAQLYPVFILGWEAASRYSTE